MLDFHNILWVVPGVIFIYFYNKKKPNEVINLSGWPYLFFLVVVATFTWLPAELIVEVYKDDKELINKLIILFISIIFTIALLLLAQIESIANLIFFPTHDNFYKKCIEWENAGVLLTLKNEKTYIGILWKYPENPTSRHESQTISIVPLQSGYRDKKTKTVVWNTYYPEYETYFDLIDMEIIIPRTEIITFGKFNNKTFEHFEKKRNKPT